MQRTHTIRRAIVGFGLVAVLAGVVVSSAFASAGSSFYGTAPGASTTQSGLPAATVGSNVASGSTGTAAEGSGFTWNAAGIGAGVGLVLLALGVGIFVARARNDSKLSRDWNSGKRRRLARWLERAAVPERPVVGRGPRYLVRPNVTVACAPSLRAIAAALRDETVMVDSNQLRALQDFVSGDSPFFGDDPTAALREVVRLQHSIIGAESATLTHEQQAAPAASDAIPRNADTAVAPRDRLSVPA
jgi:hypothetical protein